MSGPRLLVIDPSIRQVEEDGHAAVLDGWPGPARVVRPALEPGTLPPAAEFARAAGVVVLGSAASVHDDAPWLRDLGARLRPLLDGTLAVPLFGICFGHQLIARLCGAPVGFVRADRSPLRGALPTVFRGGRLLPDGATLVVAVSHCERVEAVPDGFDATAARPDVPVDALEHRALPVFSVQFHPEGGAGFLARRGVAMTEVPASFRSDGRRVLSAFRAVALAGADGGRAVPG